MNHESAPSPAATERHEEKEKIESPFDLGKMEPRHAAVIASALDLAWEVARESDSPRVGDYEELVEHLVRDLSDAASSSDKAVDIYRELVEGDLSNVGTMNIAAEMAPELLRRNLDYPERRQWVIDSIVHMLNHGGVATDAAYMVIGELLSADWLDEDTKQYLDDRYEGRLSGGTGV